MPLAVDELAEAGWCPLQGVALRVADLVIGRHADAADELPGGQRKSTWGREVTALVLLVAKVGASRHCETPIWRRRYETRRPALTAAGILFTASRLIALGYETCHFGRFPVMGLGAPRRKTDRTRHCSGWSCGPQPGPGRTPPSQNLPAVRANRLNTNGSRGSRPAKCCSGACQTAAHRALHRATCTGDRSSLTRSLPYDEPTN